MLTKKEQARINKKFRTLLDTKQVTANEIIGLVDDLLARSQFRHIKEVKKVGKDERKNLLKKLPLHPNKYTSPDALKKLLKKRGWHKKCIDDAIDELWPKI